MTQLVQTSFLPAEPPAPVVPKTVLQLLKEFAKVPGCEEYKNDSERISMLLMYLWIRQLTPGLSFETFLSLFAPLADYSDENRKHPEDSLRFHCPRSAKVAEATKKHHWTAKECVGFMTLYVDMIREAEHYQQPIPMTFDQFLGTLQAPFLAGDFKEPEPPPEAKAARETRRPTVSAAVLPTTIGQRVVYTMAGDNGRQVRGRVQTLTPHEGRQYVTVQADSGELFVNVNVQHCVVVDDPAPVPPPGENGSPKPELCRQSLLVAKAAYAQVRQALALTKPMGNVALSETIYPFAVAFPNGLEASVDVVNGEQRPFVDARLLNPTSGEVLCELPPRGNIEGLYQFEIPEGLLLLEVRGRE